MWASRTEKGILWGEILPPQNVAFRLFQAENKHDPKDLGRNFDLPPNCLKNFDRGPVTGTELSPEIPAKNMDQVW